MGLAVNAPVVPMDDALGDVTPDPNTSAGSPLLVVAAGLAVAAPLAPPRRVNAATVHSNGAADGASPVLPVRSHDSRFAPIPRTESDPAAARGA